MIKLINYFSIEFYRLQQLQFAVTRDQKTHVFYNEEKKLLKTFERVCKELDAKNREDRLFLVMNKIKNDKVKAQVMEALYNVNLDELSIEEVETLIKKLEVPNISAGNTEIILASIFWILTKLILDKKANSAEEFRKKLCKETVNESL